MTTHQLFSTVCGKADQLADYPYPRVLAITSTHFASSFLLGPQGAEYLLTSQPKIIFPVGVRGAPVRMTTDLRSAAFFDPGENGQVVPRGQSVSAVLLIGLFGDQSNVVGLLHPAPARPLNIEPFREVPFLRVRNWPIVAGAIHAEWVVSSPEAKSFPHAAIALSNRDILETRRKDLAGRRFRSPPLPFATPARARSPTTTRSCPLRCGIVALYLNPKLLGSSLW